MAQNATGADRANDRPGQDQNNDSSIFGDLDADRKAFARFAAPLAIAGYALHELSGGGCLVARWDRTLHCPDLQAVQAFCDRAGVRI